MKNALNRENCLAENMLDNIRQYDLSSYNLEDFNFGAKSMTVIKPNEVGRPDLISQRIYGTIDLWWFIMWFNGFMDAFHDLQADTAVFYVNGERVKDAIRYIKDRVNKIGD